MASPVEAEPMSVVSFLLEITEIYSKLRKKMTTKHRRLLSARLPHASTLEFVSDELRQNIWGIRQKCWNAHLHLFCRPARIFVGTTLDRRDHRVYP
jgi:hypothetical protein